MKKNSFENGLNFFQKRILVEVERSKSSLTVDTISNRAQIYDLHTTHWLVENLVLKGYLTGREKYSLGERRNGN